MYILCCVFYISSHGNRLLEKKKTLIVSVNFV